MTEAQAIEAVTQRWIDMWPALQPTVPYTFEGEPLESSGTWARMSMLHTAARQATMGGVGARRFERRGNVFVQLFSDLGVGRRQLSQMADSARAVYEARSIVVAGDDEPLTTYAGATREAPTDGRWLMTAVVFPFVYYELR